MQKIAINFLSFRTFLIAGFKLGFRGESCTLLSLRFVIFFPVRNSHALRSYKANKVAQFAAQLQACVRRVHGKTHSETVSADAASGKCSQVGKAS